MIKPRERKYRFWDIVEKRMIYPEETQCLYLDQNGKVNYCEIIIDDLAETDRFIPTDWLGITDKNNKDVYELDFVKLFGRFHGRKEDKILLIEYSCGNVAFLFSDNPEDRMGWGLGFPNKEKYYDGNKAKFLEVVGHFFELGNKD